jgi:hypothetical protein
MRRLLTLAIFSLTLAVPAALAQNQTYSGGEYGLELPSPTWRIISEPDSIHQYAEFIYGNRNDGYLRIRKEVVEAGSTSSDRASRDQETKLRFLPGYVEGKSEKFSGRLDGVTFSYEFTSGGKPMAGRVYYLQADNRTIYTLYFTGLRDQLTRIRIETDAIARSFHFK